VASIEFRQVGKAYGGSMAVKDLNLELADGEFLVMVGPSGCGKTSALRMVAGLETVSEGTLTIGGTVVNHVKARDRDIAMVFQDYALYPHMTVLENMSFNLRIRRQPKSVVQAAVQEVAKVLSLLNTLGRKPGQLSGGQRQRVAMGRAMVRKPAAFLMDEPLSNLDAKLRVQMRAEIARLQRELRVTTLYVTHDQVEAITLGDRVAVMKDGVLQQVCAPRELYDAPDNVFVATFIGSPPMNVVPGSLSLEGNEIWVELGRNRVRLDAETRATRPELAAYAGAPVLVGIRPEDLLDAAAHRDHPQDQRVTAEAVLVEELGSETLVYLDQESLGNRVEGGAAEQDATAGGGRYGCIAKFGRGSRARRGEPVEIALDTSRLHFFDAATSLAIRPDTA
jgi:multiple sugar transport system ATP-binding protein